MGPASKPSQHDQTHPPPSGLSRDIRARIGEKLQLMYGQTIYEGVPHRFDGLIRRIDGRSESQKRESQKLAEYPQDQRASKSANTSSRNHSRILGTLLLRVRKSHYKE